MLNGSFLSDVIAKIIATVVGGIILTRLASFNGWVKTNSVPLFVGFLGGVVLTAAITFLFFQHSPSPETQQAIQGPLQPLIPSLSALKREPQYISESPQQLFQWYQQFPNEVYGQEMAEKIYYGHYVEWELLINNVWPGTGGTIVAQSIIGEAKGVFCSFSKEKPESYRLEHGRKVLIRGILVRIDQDFLRGLIQLDGCQVLKFL